MIWVDRVCGFLGLFFVNCYLNIVFFGGIVIIVIMVMVVFVNVVNVGGCFYSKFKLVEVIIEEVKDIVDKKVEVEVWLVMEFFGFLLGVVVIVFVIVKVIFSSKVKMFVFINLLEDKGNSDSWFIDVLIVVVVMLSLFEGYGFGFKCYKLDYF